MTAKPSDLFIGVVDFFSILLPGALVSYFLDGLLHKTVFGPGGIFPEPEGSSAGWIAFLMATYVVGNIIFPIAASLDRIYDRFLRKIFFTRNDDLAYRVAASIRNEYVNSAGWIAKLNTLEKPRSAAFDATQAKVGAPRKEILNTYKWCQHRLAVTHPDILVEIKRIEADSKFFRSLVVAFLLIAIVLVFSQKIIAPLCFLGLAILSAYRYGDLRSKGTQRAYELIIALESTEKQESVDPTSSHPEPSDNRIEFLLSESDSTYRQLKQSISGLTRGRRDGHALYSVHGKEPFHVARTTQSEQFLCLGGKGRMQIVHGGTRRSVLLSAGGIVEPPENSSLEAENFTNTEFLLLNVGKR